MTFSRFKRYKSREMPYFIIFRKMTRWFSFLKTVKYPFTYDSFGIIVRTKPSFFAGALHPSRGGKERVARLVGV
jgi:hypothetical protein